MNTESDSSDNLFLDNSLEIIGKLSNDFNKLNNKLTNLLEENQRLKQQYTNLQEENQKILRIDSELKVSLQEKDKQLENFQQYVEKQKNEEIQQLKIISQGLEKTLETLELADINENDIKEKNESSNDENDNCNVRFDVENSSKPSWGPIYRSSVEIKVVVGIDFGTIYSGFAYSHVSDGNDIYSNFRWPGESGQLRTNTVLQYDDEYNNVISWGYPALSRRPNRWKRNETKPVELFKLHLGNLQENLKPKLPVDYKKAITDYLREFGKLIEETITERWDTDFFENVLLVLPVPAEYLEKDKAILRECVYNAGLLKEKYSEKLQFTTEQEAKAYCCIKHASRDLTVGKTFMIVDCGDDTVELTTRKLIGDKQYMQLGEITERIEDFCGSKVIDHEFIMFLRAELGTHAIDLLIENHHGQFQYIVQQFCCRAKLPFTGDDPNFFYEMDLEDIAPALKQYINDETKEKLEDDYWLIKIKYNDIKKMFDSIVDRIIRMIHIQLFNTQVTCSEIFLISENKYLQKRIKQEFQLRVDNISVPTLPTIERGAVIYGLSIESNDSADLDGLKFIIDSRVLEYTYGILLSSDWKEGDPSIRKKPDGKIDVFSPLVRRGTIAKVDQAFSFKFKPERYQKLEKFAFYYTREYSAKYVDEPGMKMLGKLAIDLTDMHPDPDKDRSILNIGLIFGGMKITAFATNEFNRQNITCTFDFDDEF